MSVMVVRCPGCNTQYAIDTRRGKPRGEVLVCPECRTECRLTADGAVARRARRKRPPEAPPPKPRDRETLVSCPSCGHRFAASAESPPRTPRRRCILLVEDQKYFARLTRDALGPQLNVTVAADLAEARRLIETTEFDLSILDLSLETAGDGRQLLGALRRRGVPVLIFTARDETEIYGPAWEELREAGATDILLKGMNVADDLRRKVLEMLGPDREGPSGA